MATRSDSLRATLDRFQLDPTSKEDRPYLVSVLRRLGFEVTEADLDDWIKGERRVVEVEYARDWHPRTTFEIQGGPGMEDLQEFRLVTPDDEVFEFRLVGDEDDRPIEDTGDYEALPDEEDGAWVPRETVEDWEEAEEWPEERDEEGRRRAATLDRGVVPLEQREDFEPAEEEVPWPEAPAEAEHVDETTAWPAEGPTEAQQERPPAPWPGTETAPELPGEVTVDLYKGNVRRVIDVEGIGAEYAEKLQAVGIHDTEQLQAFPAAAIAHHADLSESRVRRWQAMSELMTVRGIGPQYAEVLARAGISGIDDLRNRSAENVLAANQTFLESVDSTVLRQPPTLKRITTWKATVAEMHPERTTVARGERDAVNTGIPPWQRSADARAAGGAGGAAHVGGAAGAVGRAGTTASASRTPARRAGGDGYSHGPYTLCTREVELSAGQKERIYFFAKQVPQGWTPCPIPDGFSVKENERTGLPFLERQRGA